MRYCLGFCVYDRDIRDGGRSVVLIEKAKDRGPEAVRGKLNGVGGKIDSPESALHAMQREFREETGVRLSTPWEYRFMLHGRDWEVDVYLNRAEPLEALGCFTQTDETVKHIPLARLWYVPVVPNLLWMVPLALDTSVQVGAIVDVS